MSTSVELALAALILQFSAILDAMALGSTVETLVVSRWRASLAFTLLLLIPGEGADVFFGSQSQAYLCCFHLVESFAGSGLLPCSRVHAIRFQVTADFF